MSLLELVVALLWLGGAILVTFVMDYIIHHK